MRILYLRGRTGGTMSLFTKELLGGQLIKIRTRRVRIRNVVGIVRVLRNGEKRSPWICETVHGRCGRVRRRDGQRVGGWMRCEPQCSHERYTGKRKEQWVEDVRERSQEDTSHLRRHSSNLS